MPKSSALEALQAAAHGFRRREVMAGDTPFETERRRLLAWLEERDDHREPLLFEHINLADPLPAGQRVLLPGDEVEWFVKMPLHNALPRRWLPREPSASHLTRQSPQELLWHDDPGERRFRCGAAALLRFAADGDAEALVEILSRRNLPAAASLVKRHADADGWYGFAAGGVARELPSPRRLLTCAFADLPVELEWLRELAEGGDHWDSGPGGLEVPRGEAVLPGQAHPPATWISKL